MSAHNSRHGTTCSISSRNTCRRVFFVYRSKPFIVARLLCCLVVDLIWRNLLYLPVERETLFRLSLGGITGVSKANDRFVQNWFRIMNLEAMRKIAGSTAAGGAFSLGNFSRSWLVALAVVGLGLSG